MAATLDRRTRLSHRARGQTIVEMAVVFPLLVFVALGLVQFALVYHARNVVETAAQEAAHTSAAVDSTRQQGIDRGLAVLGAGLNSKITKAVDVSFDTGERATASSVTAVAHASLPTFIPRLSFSGGPPRVTVELSASATVSRERFRESS